MASGQVTSFESLQGVLARRIEGLDAIRALAVIWVIWHNVIGDFPLAGWPEKLLALFTHAGWVGVQAFFVLSGFLITGILLDLRGSEGRLADKFKVFYWRRSLRIFPLYYSTLLVCLFLLPDIGMFTDSFTIARQNQLWYWTYTVNIAAVFTRIGELGHFWSLAIEEQFYLCWPLAVFLLSNQALMRLAVCLFFSALAFRIGLLMWAGDFYHAGAYLLTVARWDTLATGALLALCVRDRALTEALLRNGVALTVLLVLVIVVLVGCTQNFTSTPVGIGVLNQTVAALASALLIFHCLTLGHRHAVKRMLLDPLLNHIGRYSYALYVFHLPVRDLWLQGQGQAMVDSGRFGLIPAWILNFLIVLLISYVLARISWLLIESPFLRLKDRLTLRSGAAAGGVVQVSTMGTSGKGDETR